MITIPFASRYRKQPADLSQTYLLDVLPIKLEHLSWQFLDFDTLMQDGKHYPLQETGDYLLLILASPQMWTTLRKAEPGRLEKYRGQIGERVEIVIEATL